jgi:hypothetical protein
MALTRNTPLCKIAVRTDFESMTQSDDAELVFFRASVAKISYAETIGTA